MTEREGRPLFWQAEARPAPPPGGHDPGGHDTWDGTGSDGPPAEPGDPAAAAPGPASAEADAEELGTARPLPRVPLSERLRVGALRCLRWAREREERRALAGVSDQRAEKKRQLSRLLCAAVLFFVALAFVVWLCQRGLQARRPVVYRYQSDYTVAPAGVDRESFQSQYEERLSGLDSKVSGLEGVLSALDQRVEKLRLEERRRDTSRQRAAAEREEQAAAAVPPLPAEGGLSSDEATRLLAQQRNARPRLGVLRLDERRPTEQVAALAHPLRAAPVGRLSEAPIARNRASGEAERSYLPAGTFMRAAVLSGVTAPTGGGASANPMPMLLEVTDMARLPNTFRARVERCFVTASATGDLSSERVLIRLDRLSCMSRRGRAIDVRLQGYATGEDGKTGVRGRLVTRSGQAVANAIFMGLLSGVGEAVSLSAQSTTTYAAGNTSSVVSDPWRAGLGEGLSDAMDRVVDYYLRLADKIFPVLELDGGRQVELVLSQGVTVAELEEGQPAPAEPAPRPAPSRPPSPAITQPEDKR